MQSARTDQQKDDCNSLDAYTTQYIVFYVLLGLIELKKKSTQRLQICRLVLTSKAWRDLMLAPLNIKLNTRTIKSIVSKSTIEILRHRLFAAAGLVTLKNNAVVYDEYDPPMLNLISIPANVNSTSSTCGEPITDDTHSSDELSSSSEGALGSSSESITLKSKKCYAVGIVVERGLKKSFESGEYFSSKFKVFEERSDAEAYARSIPESVMGYSISPRVVQPIQIRPRKLSSGGIDQALSLQFFKVAADEMRSAAATPTPDDGHKFKSNLD